MSAQQKLLEAMNRLQKATAESVADREPAWRQQVEDMLAQLEDAVPRHAQEIAATDGELVDVDRPLIPSPTLQHRGAHLGQELDRLLEETRSLRRELQDPASLVNEPDSKRFCQRAHQLVQDLERCESQEAALIQESVTTDIGAGD